MSLPNAPHGLALRRTTAANCARQSSREKWRRSQPTARPSTADWPNLQRQIDLAGRRWIKLRTGGAILMLRRPCKPTKRSVGFPDASATLASAQLEDWFGFIRDRTVPYDGGLAGECFCACEERGILARRPDETYVTLGTCACELPAAMLGLCAQAR